jgi:hypothetical protein
VHLGGDDERVWGGDEGVLSDRLADAADRDLGGEGVAVRDERDGIALVDVDCRKNRRSGRSGGRGKREGGGIRTLDTPAARLERAHVALDGALADELMPDEICVVRGGDVVLAKRARHVVPDGVVKGGRGRVGLVGDTLGVMRVEEGSGFLRLRAFLAIGKTGIVCRREEGGEGFKGDGGGGRGSGKGGSRRGGRASKDIAAIIRVDVE